MQSLIEKIENMPPYNAIDGIHLLKKETVIALIKQHEASGVNELEVLDKIMAAISSAYANTEEVPNGMLASDVLGAIRPYLKQQQPVSADVVEVLKMAKEAIENLHQHGDWDNGVYDPTGSICEGVVSTARYVSDAIKRIDAAMQANITAKE